MYRIESITGKDGLERTDGRYPLRKGCIGNIYDVIIGQVLWFEYLADNEGNVKTGYLRTSMIESFVEDFDRLIIETLNSVYYFRKIIIE